MRTLDDIPLSPKDRRAVEAAARLLRERYPVEEVILFGSKARGDDSPESDIDLLVLTSTAIDYRERWRIYDALYEVMLAEDVVIGLMVEPRDEWRHGLGRALPLRREVERDGVVV